MKIGQTLDAIDLGAIALPVFQRGYVWNREQVRQLFTSLYLGYPVGSLLFWATQSGAADVKGDIAPAVSPVKMLLDGQQRITSLYGVMRGKPPAFFEGNERAFTGLHFHLEEEAFEFYQPVKMQHDPCWVDVTKVMLAADDDVAEFAAGSAANVPTLLRYVHRLGKLRGIRDRELNEETISGQDKTVDVVVEIFNRVNRGGTKLSTGDLALARICAEWSGARDEMQGHLGRWDDAGYDRFDLDWLLRSVNTVLTGEARLVHLDGQLVDDIKDALASAAKALDAALNMVGDKLGLDHGRVLFGRNAFPVMARYIHGRGGALNDAEWRMLLYWYAYSAMRGRYSGSVETVMDLDLEEIEDPDNGLGSLLHRLRESHATEIRASDFGTATRNSRFYPMLYLLTRMGSARDLCSGIVLKADLLGKGSKLEVHHIFPKSQLRKQGYSPREINALANFCFLTADCNKKISNKLPEKYLPGCEQDHPGVLASQWIPQDHELWSVDRYRDFLEVRRQMLAEAANTTMDELLHGSGLLGQPGPLSAPVTLSDEGDEEEAALVEINQWMLACDLLPGTIGYEIADGGGVLDLAWPDGVQPELTQPVAVLLDEPEQVIAAANSAGFICFTSAASFRAYVEAEILGEAPNEA